MKKVQLTLALLIGLLALTTKCYSQSSSSEVVIGCFSGSTGILGYSSAQLDIIVALYLQDGNNYTNSSLKYDVDEGGVGFFYIRSETTGQTIGIPLETTGTYIFVKDGCKHSCSSSGNCSCDLKIVTKCESIQCIRATGTGGCSSSIETGYTTFGNTALIRYITENPPLSCN
jgi:hypothetical protein